MRREIPKYAHVPKVYIHLLTGGQVVASAMWRCMAFIEVFSMHHWPRVANMVNSMEMLVVTAHHK